MADDLIGSVEEFIVAVRRESASWPAHQPRWFRGEPEGATPLLPSLYRGPLAQRENELLQTFRSRAPGFSDRVPDRKKTDQWLFLAQHVGVPTRLLDWSEAALIALYFAVGNRKPPLVWMLNPLQLNFFAAGAPADADPNDERQFPLPWFRPKPPRMNPACENIRGAWEEDRPGVPLPVAIHPTYVHDRLRNQRACFTVHGKRKEGLHLLVPASILKCFRINPERREAILRDLMVLGVAESTAFPDLGGLAEELRTRFS